LKLLPYFLLRVFFVALFVGPAANDRHLCTAQLASAFDARTIKNTHANAARACPPTNQVREYIAEKLGGVGPRFVGILANTDPAARKYAEWTGRACMKDGIRYEVR